jgi:hypothetical protein
VCCMCGVPFAWVDRPVRQELSVLCVRVVTGSFVSEQPYKLVTTNGIPPPMPGWDSFSSSYISFNLIGNTLFSYR